MEQKTAKLIEKHINDFGDCYDGNGYFVNIIADAAKEGFDIILDFV